MLDIKNFESAMRYEGGLSRRLFLAYGAAFYGMVQASQNLFAKVSNFSFKSNPFALGVASGEPTHDSVLLWTRLAPDFLQEDYGVPALNLEVKWEVSDDENFTKIVKKGTSLATPQLGHSIHVEVKGLASDRWYFYRFMSGDFISAVGRTRTMPAADANPDKLVFAFASCQHFESGLYTAYEYMIKENPDMVFFLGDYIYEYKGVDKRIRRHVGQEVNSLSEYRARISQYRADPLLHNMHASCPWFVTWDDHEFDNNYAADISEEKNIDPVEFLVRRADSYQAYYEMMPLRVPQVPQGPDMKLYRHAKFGRLAEFNILDTRQYRTDQPNGDKHSPLNEEAVNKNNSIMGKKQKGWLMSNLIQSQGLWNIIPQQVMVGMVGFQKKNDPTTIYSMDQWPGCAHERMELLDFIRTRKVQNTVFLTGDIHVNYASELRVDDRNLDLPVIACELVGTSISSGGNLSPTKSLDTDTEAIIRVNPFVKFHNAERGYVKCTVTQDQYTADYITIDDIHKPGGIATNRGSFVIESGIAKINKS